MRTKAEDPEPIAEQEREREALAVEDGLEIVVLTAGRGQKALPGQRVAVHYDGYLLDGTLVDSSRERGIPFEFELGRGMVIEGFEATVRGMRVGGKHRATIPARFGYGNTGRGKIPAGSTLVFEIELLEIKSP